MNELINNGARFSEAVGSDVKRSGFVRQTRRPTSCSVGVLYPFIFDEILPTDKFELDTALSAVLQPSVFPTADTIVADVHYFFCPYRILWDYTKEFYGEVDPGQYATSQHSVMPYFLQTAELPTIASLNVLPGDVLDRLGVPPDTNVNYCNALPYRAYRLIWNEWYRNTALQPPLPISKGDVESYYVPHLLHVNRFKDYFASCLPEPQFSESSAIAALSGVAPVDAFPYDTFSTPPSNPNIVRYQTYKLDPQTSAATQVDGVTGVVSYNNIGPSGSRLGVDGTSVGFNDVFVQPYNQRANFNDALSTAGLAVTAIRSAVAIQRYLEAQNRGGRRYREALFSHWGSQIPDATAQIPEFLGGCRFNINMSANVQTSQTTDTSAAGSLSGVSITKQRSFTTIPHAFTEPGIIMGLISFRVLDHIYQQGVPRFFFKRTKEDLYWPEFEGVSEQPTYKGELYFDVHSGFGSLSDPGSNAHVFGYNEYASEYRYLPSYLSGQLRRSVVNNSLAPWTYADYYASSPTLSAAWMCEPRENVDNTLAYTSGTLSLRPFELDEANPCYYWNWVDYDSREQLNDQFMCDIGIQIKSERPIPVFSVPGIGVM